MNVKLDPDSYDRLVTWMGTYAHILGFFSEEQEEQIRQLREHWAHMLARE